MIWPFGGRSWRGYDGEPEMTEEDWALRGHEQAMAMREGGSWRDSSPDEDGEATGGCYNGDYTEEQHAAANERLEQDEYFEAQTQQNIWSLFRADNARREAEDAE